jgi:hypothetical protein
MSEDVVLLNGLYTRQKQLLLSVGASLAMGDAPAGARGEAESLLADCDAAGPGERYDACREGAAQLVALLADADRLGGPPSHARITAARAAHSRLRRVVWDVSGCEYVPCAKTEGGSCA